MAIFSQFGGEVKFHIFYRENIFLSFLRGSRSLDSSCISFINVFLFHRRVITEAVTLFFHCWWPSPPGKSRPSVNCCLQGWPGRYPAELLVSELSSGARRCLVTGGTRLILCQCRTTVDTVRRKPLTSCCSVREQDLFWKRYRFHS